MKLEFISFWAWAKTKGLGFWDFGTVNWGSKAEPRAKGF